jgi:Na+/H+ antiporter NhaC
MTDLTDQTRYPLRVRGKLTEPLSRWLWLVKWFLLIPHVIVLVFLWTAYAVITVIAFFAILITGRYPHG